ncbi:MAG: peptide permease [Fervidicoccus fontis]|uniref:Peptide/nickel transport system permease protein n=1 Tax=Thermodesulfobium acidiphilum TaxID=1794699 RepID=A0A2R4VZJ5_THEAF|nr:ABC transporter permease [Thermodesulfobium acidiphilum]AWB09840.1 peptide/nickel transport system permease protein [Thermodesulfobium acidiphilum]PMB77300.1 MAG: peptide permease [Fervidicoccus fontis]HEM55127.1 ABC transporter permease [Thermodesulfobium narugense]
MAWYITKRLLSAIALVFIISAVSFFIIHLAPGDPSTLLIDPRVKPEDLARIRNNLGLNQSIYVQFLIWFKNVLFLNFGRSFVDSRPVLDLILERLPATLELMGSAYLIGFSIGILWGILSALFRDKFDIVSSIISFIGLSVPSFFLALILIRVFAVSLKWFPVNGYVSVGIPYPSLEFFSNHIAHLALPVFTISLGIIFSVMRYQRNAAIEVFQEEYIQFAIAKGLSKKRITFHVLIVAIIPIITLLGLSLPDILGGAFIIETIFAWPGIGRLGVNAIFSRDYPVIMGIVVFSSVLVILSNLLADIINKLLDPRTAED